LTPVNTPPVRRADDGRMSRRIALIQGHPDRDPARYCRALATAYVEGAREAGHAVRVIDVAALEFPLLRSRADWQSGDVSPDIASAMETAAWADHLVFVFPMWLGEMPALMKGFLEQVARPGFAIAPWDAPRAERKRHMKLAGKSAHVVMTMGMPAPFYRWYFRAHSLRSLERNILGFAGIGPVRESLVGMVEGKPARRQRWLERLREAGRAGD
jgi:putative NADPH-quinone reductase